MNTLVFIGLLGIFSYFNLLANKNFKGSSSLMKNLLFITGNLGYWSFWVFIIWSFFIFTLWQPLIVFLSASLVGGVLAGLFDRTIIGMLVSLLACPVFWILSLLMLLGVF